MHTSVTLTPKEKLKLAQAITKAATGIAECWDVLRQIESRIGRDWMPHEMCVADIAHNYAVSIDDPKCFDRLDPEMVGNHFTNDRDWTRP
jgi:hypothetical protein